jgi:hypothetical protein
MFFEEARAMRNGILAMVSSLSMVKVHYNPSNGNVTMSNTLQDSRRVSMNIVDQRGRRIAAVIDGVIPAGRHEAVWNAKRVPAGVYVWRITVDGKDGWTGKIVTCK